MYIVYIYTNTLQLIFHLGNVGRQTDLQVVIYQNRLDRGTYLHYYCEMGKLSIYVVCIQNILIKGNDYIVSFEKLNEKIIATNDLLISSKIRLNQDKQCRCFSFDRGLFLQEHCFELFLLVHSVVVVPEIYFLWLIIVPFKSIQRREQKMIGSLLKKQCSDNSTKDIVFQPISTFLEDYVVTYRSL